jgi:lipid-binding SYLF domain-containing protein
MQRILRSVIIAEDIFHLFRCAHGGQTLSTTKDIIIAFMTDAALAAFRASDGWEAGGDGNIALINVGAGGSVDTTTVRDPIVGFVFDVKGLMADVSLKGAKITKLNKSQ